MGLVAARSHPDRDPPPPDQASEDTEEKYRAMVAARLSALDTMMPDNHRRGHITHQEEEEYSLALGHEAWGLGSTCTTGPPRVGHLTSRKRIATTKSELERNRK